MSCAASGLATDWDFLPLARYTAGSEEIFCSNSKAHSWLQSYFKYYRRNIATPAQAFYKFEKKDKFPIDKNEKRDILL
jgi:hypothetical protein